MSEHRTNNDKRKQFVLKNHKLTLSLIYLLFTSLHYSPINIDFSFQTLTTFPLQLQASLLVQKRAPPPQSPSTFHFEGVLSTTSAEVNHNIVKETAEYNLSRDLTNYFTDLTRTTKQQLSNSRSSTNFNGKCKTDLKRNCYFLKTPLPQNDKIKFQKTISEQNPSQQFLISLPSPTSG
jgi:hypothetical protein